MKTNMYIRTAPRKDWSLSEWIANFLQEDIYYEEGYEAFDEGMITGSDGEPLNDVLEDVDAVVESLIILGLVGAIVILMYYRARRQQAHAQAEAEAARQGQQGGGGVQQQQQAQGQQGGGLFAQPDAPDFGQWAAGAVGQ